MKESTSHEFLSGGIMIVGLRGIQFLFGVVAVSTTHHSLAATLPLPTSISINLVSPSISADGTTGVIASLKNADGSLYVAQDLPLSFSSNCLLTKTSDMENQVTTVRGVAAASYQPRTCTGNDVITVSYGSGVSAIKASVVITIGANKVLSARASLGKAMFFDKGLSAAGNISCASCHSPSNLYHSPQNLSTPIGGINGNVLGFRTAPSAAYAALIPPFRFLPVTNQNGTTNNLLNGKLGTPRSGLMWDGREATVFSQAKGPFTGPHEMGHATSTSVLQTLLTRPYVRDYIALFGPLTINSNPDTVLTNIGNVIGRFESEDPSFQLFNSKFDAVQKNLASFTPQEANGQLLFNAPNKGACAGCHNSNGAAQTNAGSQLFSDFSYRALAVPRNWQLPYNVDATAQQSLASLNLLSLLNGRNLGAPNFQFYDLGFCGPFRTDSLTDTGLCGAFRVPGLRNVAQKNSYFHNGVFASLDQVLNFYLNRDINPASVYKKADGSPDLAYNDLPVVYLANREIRPPFTAPPAPPAPRGQARPPAPPRLSASEVQDLISFLCTLSDGYDPQRPASYQQNQQCTSVQRK